MLGRLLERIRRPEAEPQDDNLLLIEAAATLLMEVAWADHDISTTEIGLIEEILVGCFELTPEAARTVVERARAAHSESVGLYEFTRTLVEAWTEPQRFELVLQLWRLALADERLDRFEEHTIRKIAELLYVSHPRFIEAKRRAKSQASDPASD